MKSRVDDHRSTNLEEDSELRKRLEEEVHLRQIAAIVESSDDAIIGNTLDGTITSWNPAAERIYGYSAAEAIGQSIDMLVPEALRGDVPGILAQVQAGDRVEQYETGRARKDGTVIDVWLTISGVKDSFGAIVGASTIARDINERLRGVEALHQSEDSYRALFERHPSPMWLYDLETLRFLTVNEAAIASYGYSREEFLSMTIDEIRVAEAAEDSRRNSANDPDAPSGSRHRRKDGTFIEVLVSSDSIEFEGHQASLVLAQDMTEQRRLEEHLRQAQKMEAIGNLAGGIAHDFNNLLLVIRGYSAILLKQLTDEHLRESAQQIDGAAQLAGEFTHQLLAFSRQQVLRPEVSDLNEIVAETLTLLRRSIGGEISVESQFEPALGAVLVDRGQIAQAVLNLAINARDAMSEEGGRLSIRTANAELDRDLRNGPRRRCARVVRPLADHGLRSRNGQRDPEPRFRPLLHDQGGGQWSWPGHGLRPGEAERRPHLALQRTRDGNDLQALLPDHKRPNHVFDRIRRTSRRSWAPAPKQSCSSKTPRWCAPLSRRCSVPTVTRCLPLPAAPRR